MSKTRSGYSQYRKSGDFLQRYCICKPRRAPEAVVQTESHQHSSGLELPELSSSASTDLPPSVSPPHHAGALFPYTYTDVNKINICLAHPTRLHLFILCKGTVS